MSNITKSSGGIVYKIDEDGTPRFLIIKRFSLSKRIEWVAPKGKINKGETAKKAALREIAEETGLALSKMKLEKKLGTVDIHLSGKGDDFNKNIQYYLVKYKGKFDDIDIEKAEGYLGYYRWASIHQALNLIYYKNLREIYRKAYRLVLKRNKLK